MAQRGPGPGRLNPKLNLKTSLDSLPPSGAAQNGGSGQKLPYSRSHRAHVAHADNEGAGTNHDQGKRGAGSVSTPPLEIPHDRVALYGSSEKATGMPNSNDSAVEEFLRNRSTSITFSPEAKTDTGHRVALDQPLPKSRVRGRSLIEEMSNDLNSKHSRANSDSEQANFDPETGRPLRADAQYHLTAPQPPEVHPGESRHPLLQSTVNQLAEETGSRSLDMDRIASLTSASTMSPVVEEAATPPSATNPLTFSPMSMTGHWQPKSLKETSAWPGYSPRSDPHRANSYTFGKPSSSRRTRQTSSRKASANGISPASSFLSRWSTTEETPAEPDAEGQQIGEDYVIGKQIGFGGFSAVKEAFTFENNEHVRRAVKIVRKQVLGRDDRENDQLQAEFEHEVSLWRCLDHPNLLRLHAVYDTSFATFCIIPLNSGGTLFDLIRRNRQGLQASLVQRYGYQLASALRYLHEDIRIVHRDVKLENCLVDMTVPDAESKGGDIRLCDFGMAEWISNAPRSSSPDPYASAADRPATKNIGPAESSTNVGGSLQYAAPELLSNSNDILSTAVDIWAFGVVMYALLVGSLPFQHTFEPRVQMMILRGEWDREKALGSHGGSEEALELITGCLEMDPEKRWDISQVLSCDWFSAVDSIPENGPFGGGWNL